MVIAYKQDMPPPGGYKKLFVDRTYVKKWMNGPRWLAFGAGFFTVAYMNTMYHKAKKRGESLINHDVKIAMQPFLMAERDRNWLKFLKKNRDAEAEVMKDVPGWQAGTWYGEPVYLTKEADDAWWDPDFYDVQGVTPNWDREKDLWYHWHVSTMAGPHWYDKYLPEWLTVAVQ